MTEDEMAGWHHQLDGHEFERTPGVGDGQGGLACCGSWSCKGNDFPLMSYHILGELFAYISYWLFLVMTYQFDLSVQFSSVA